MIIWLASFPRSGNTLTRTILHRCFGTGSATVYKSLFDEAFADFIGSAPGTGDLSSEQFVQHARESDETYIVKTHELPDDDEPAIIVVRDGRAACASFAHYQSDILGLHFPLEQIVIGAQPLKSWSEHVIGWTQSSRRKLVLRYEDLRDVTPDVLSQLGDFIGKPQIATYDLSFSELQATEPRFFRVGRNDPGIRLIEQRCPALFWLNHGDAMRSLGFGMDNERPFTRALVNEALVEVGRAMDRTRRGDSVHPT